MATTPRGQYRLERRFLQAAPFLGEASPAERGAIAEFLDARDAQVVSTPSNGIKTTDSGHSLRSYCNTLRMTAQRADFELTEATAEDLNGFMDDLISGAHPAVKDDGLSPRTVNSYQGVLRKFYDYHSDMGVEKDDIEIVSVDRTPVDERDMFTRAEIDDMRQAIDHNRDRALFELLLNTGQRLTAIQTLRIQDVDLQERAIYLNPEADGLKGADRAGNKRPMLGAYRACYDWMRDHPASGDPDAYFITHKPSWSRGGAGEMLTAQQIGRILKGIGNRAGVDKPVNPHAFRHNFVTIAKRDYDLDDSVVKRLTGHADGSKVMETTYAHLSMDDVAEKAEIGAGLREPDESRLTPVACPTCGEPLAEDAKACEGCGTVFTLDAKDAADEIQQDIGAERALSDGEVTEEHLETIAGSDSMLARLIELRAERQG